MRGLFAGADSFLAKGSSASGIVGSPRATEERAFELTSAAGRRLLLRVAPEGSKAVRQGASANLLWGTPAGYFAWRPRAGVEELGQDFERIVQRCALAVPRIGELLALLAGRDLGPVSPLASRPQEVVLESAGASRLLRWLAADGVTGWAATLRSSDGALLGLDASAVVDFDLERALDVRARELGLAETEQDRRGRLRLQLESEREEARWHRLTLEPCFGVDLDERTFEVAP